MWHDLKIDRVDKIEKCVGEYQIRMHSILAYEKVKIKIYESQDRTYTGVTDVSIKRKSDGEFEAVSGFGNSIEEALEDTIKYFLEIVDSDYPSEEYPYGLSGEEVEYMEYSDF